MRQAFDAASAFDLPDAFGGCESVAVLGMGGSGIGGSLLRAFAAETGSRTPIEVVRGYHLPAYISERTLAIASSNSGNTEEVLALAQAAVKQGARCVAVTTGGALLDLARARNFPALTYEWSGEPRSALGWSFASLLAICGRLGFVPLSAADLDAALAHMSSLAVACATDVPEASTQAKQIARRWHGRLPVIAGAGVFAPVAYRWRTQVNENGKSWGVWLELPEMNHNAPVGYGMPAAVVPDMHAVLLRQSGGNARVSKRIDLSHEQMQKAGVSCEIIDVPGASVLAQMLWAIQLGDFASYYLGILNGADPSEVRALDWLKSKMAK
jgi:glucose/mannose-6-phosphate isomerase